MQKGEIIPEDLTFNYLRHEFSKEKYNQGFVLDGYPKDKGCYEFIINYFNETNRKISTNYYQHGNKIRFVSFENWNGKGELKDPKVQSEKDPRRLANQFFYN